MVLPRLWFSLGWIVDYRLSKLWKCVNYLWKALTCNPDNVSKEINVWWLWKHCITLLCFGCIRQVLHLIWKIIVLTSEVVYNSRNIITANNKCHFFRSMGYLLRSSLPIRTADSIEYGNTSPLAQKYKLFYWCAKRSGCYSSTTK